MKLFNQKRVRATSLGIIITGILIILFVCLVQPNHRTALPTDILTSPWDPEGGLNSSNPLVPVVCLYSKPHFQ